ncbi:uncharacterized protein LOC132883603 isoform X3 [Neoarius graeffei]|uniref:uncharacterized protein LOC132883603 isoform X3 n=1 Tax=Neoarius graeffei TaxID=443677 RepID=UPI00298C4655|nr:uncharacterized protein LOC132883603 isoform X3 [Neoarius graeffei]
MEVVIYQSDHALLKEGERRAEELIPEPDADVTAPYLRRESIEQRSSSPNQTPMVCVSVVLTLCSLKSVAIKTRALPT